MLVLCFSVSFAGCGDNNVPTTPEKQSTEISGDGSIEKGNTDSSGKDEASDIDGKQDDSEKKESNEDSSGGITLPEIDFD